MDTFCIKHFFIHLSLDNIKLVCLQKKDRYYIFMFDIALQNNMTLLR